MEEPVRLVCSECEAVYRVKNFNPEKAYSCKKCGSSLQSMSDADKPIAPAAHPATIIKPAESTRAVSAPPVSMKRLNALADTLAARLDALGDAESRALKEGLAEVDSRIETLSQNINKNLEEHAAVLVEGSKVFAEGVTTLSSQIDLNRLGQLGVHVRETGDLFLRRLEEYRERQAGEIESIVKQTLTDSLKDQDPQLDPEMLSNKISQELTERLNSGFQDINDNLKEINTILADLTQMVGLEDRLPGIVGDKIESLVIGPANTALEALRQQEERLAELGQKIAESNSGDATQVADSVSEKVLARLDEAALSKLHNSMLEQQGGVQRLESLVADITKNSAAMADLSGQVTQEMSGKIQSLVLAPIEQSLTKHIEEISRASAGLEEAARREPDIDGISSRIADAVGKHVENQVVVPVANALARQAPQILSHVQNDQLSEVVLKSVRDAQRPLLREVVNGRRGVPLWLFASLLLPLLLILGYLFADVLGLGGGEMQSERINETITRELSRLSASGVPLTAEDNARLRTIEGLMVNSENLINTMYENAWAQVKSNGTLEAEVRNLRRSLEERDKLISEYNSSLQQQSKRIRAYEIQLTRLGISPDTVPDSE